MNEENLQALERQFEKAKRGDGPQALASFAAENVPALFEGVRRGISFATDAAGALAGDLVTLAALYPGVEPEALLAHAAADIRGLRADRAARVGTGPQIDQSEAVGELVDALRPFAKLAAPETLEAIHSAAAAHGLDWDGESIITIAGGEDVPVLILNRAQCQRALDLVTEADGA